MQVALSACSETPKQALGSTVWQAQCEDVGSGGYQACYGPGRIENGADTVPHFNKYRISVDRASSGSSISVFEKEYEINEVDPKLIDRDAHDVVFFNATTRQVVFKLGRTEAAYKIP